MVRGEDGVKERRIEGTEGSDQKRSTPITQVWPWLTNISERLRFSSVMLPRGLLVHCLFQRYYCLELCEGLINNKEFIHESTGLSINVRRNGQQRSTRRLSCCTPIIGKGIGPVEGTSEQRDVGPGKKDGRSEFYLNVSQASGYEEVKGLTGYFKGSDQSVDNRKED